MSQRQTLHLQYGVNVFADDAYKHYRPPRITAHYPDPQASELRGAIAQYVGCDQDMILCSSGSDELIDLYIRLHKKRIPRLKLAFSPPTYPMYEAYGARNEVEFIRLPSDMSTISPEQILAHGGSPLDTIVMLDSPSNPSGQEVSREQFIELLDAGFQVYADEAYYEFKGNTVWDMIDTYPGQLVVSRSFSKFAAMSGSRVGYLIATPKIIEEFRSQQLFFNVNTEGQHRALYALRHTAEFYEAISRMHVTSQQLQKEIEVMGSYHLFPSLDMFTIFLHKRMSTQELHHKLQHDHAIETQRFADFGGHDVIRTAVLQMPVMQRFVNALRAYA